MMKQTSNIDPSVEEGQGLNGSVSSSSDGTRTGDHDVDAGIMKGDDELQDQSETKNGTYPADCYSFLAIHGPIKSPAFFTFGLIVWMFQIAFLILLTMRVASRRFSTSEDSDNPTEGFLSVFIPSNVEPLSRATQFMALLSYCLFADESLKDIVTAVETFPKFSKTKEGDNIRCMVFSCVLRFTQGMLATVVVLLLVINTPDVIDIILNFTAVNFISGFDDVAFELAQWGKYGPKLEAEAKRIEELPVPDCMYNKYHHVRYRFTILPIATVLLIALSTVTVQQNSKDVWLTNRLRVQFEDDSSFEPYSGCYDVTADSEGKRVVYESFEANFNSAKIGYCREDRKWYFFTGNSTTACDIPEEQVAYSDRTYTFDISTSFEESWYSSSGTPLELYFFDDEDSLDDEQCGSFLGDGVCNVDFNKLDYGFDQGDCCAATCDDLICGVGTMTEVFDTDVMSGDGFPNCKNPDMKPITILLNDIYLPVEGLGKTGDDPMSEMFGDAEPRNPLMILDCDGQNLLMVSLEKAMKNKTETVMVADGASCTLSVKNETSGPLPIFFVDYTVFHGDEKSIDRDPIVMIQGDSSEEAVSSFQRIEECFFVKLDGHVDKTTIYTDTDPSNQAIHWLMDDSLGFSNCEEEQFIERYALAAINFAAPIFSENSADNETKTDNQGLWIATERHCVWSTVACTDGIVTELDLGTRSLSGTIATEIGLLQNLSHIDMSFNLLYGSIPPQVGQWKSLTYISLATNILTGTIPSDVSGLTNLEWMFINNNEITGSIPSEIGEMSSLISLFSNTNEITGSIPSEIGEMSSLKNIVLYGNLLTGTIPSEIGEVQNMEYLVISDNDLSGTIPSELGQVASLHYIYMSYNDLTGSVPSELFDKNYASFDLYGNQLSDLTPVDGKAICSAEEGEHYCDCGNDCMEAMEWEMNQCACEEGQSCCTTWREQYTP